ncbi:unnamed protein product [Durusdinium trenchii]|uniref:Methyltransferase type 11 domain-containing protein n=1 Tax=Durusdinium trenchii TaxID=1381693 RepID=A0ABP0MEI4_9DINO
MSQSDKPLVPQPRRSGCGLFCCALPVLLLALSARLAGLFLDVEDVYEKGFALYNILTLPQQAYEEFLQSYDVYDYASDKELEDAYGEDWRNVEMRKHKHTYTVIQYYCALVSCQKMYVAPLFNTMKGNEENQVIYEYQLARWLKGDWDDQPFNGGARRAADAVVPKKTKRVLEVGCGQGRILQELGRFLGADWELMGMNLDGNQLRHAKERPVEVRMRDMNHMPYDWIANASVDGAYNLGAVTFQRDLEEHAQEMARILTPGSRFVVACDWTNFDDEKGLNLQDPEHRRLWSGARRLGAAGRYCYSEKEYVAAFAKHNFKHVHSEVYGARYVQALHDMDTVRRLAAEWMKTVAKVDIFGALDQALTMMQRFGRLFTYCASHVFELQR